MSELKPCPFCGAAAHRVDISEATGADETDPNFGGSFIECRRCGACTAIHFDRQEALVSRWNDRTREVLTDAMYDAGKQAVIDYTGCDKADPSICCPMALAEDVWRAMEAARLGEAC